MSIQFSQITYPPAMPGRAEITDAHRVYPGDGVAPLADMLRDLRRIGFRGVLSLELFNRDYWRQDAFTVARTGLEKMRAVLAATLHWQRMPPVGARSLDRASPHQRHAPSPLQNN